MRVVLLSEECTTSITNAQLLSSQQRGDLNNLQQNQHSYDLIQDALDDFSYRCITKGIFFVHIQHYFLLRNSRDFTQNEEGTKSMKRTKDR